ncbi:uncharacterized protein LOC141855551 [Brevipalpus obovatus]|uniref:uncharacterized protein LOC141855551 n=1 Tax=Brevipalpus obovatus TaxID=246614 RepID=UPI003D9E7FE8
MSSSIENNNSNSEDENLIYNLRSDSNDTCINVDNEDGMMLMQASPATPRTSLHVCMDPMEEEDEYRGFKSFRELLANFGSDSDRDTCYIGVNSTSSSTTNCTSSSCNSSLKKPRSFMYTLIGSDTFSRGCRVPLPNFLNTSLLDSSGFIQRRNERERARVRNVNEGFERLRKHLPLSPSQREKRLSKVETLKMAIAYIRHLQKILEVDELIHTYPHHHNHHHHLR